MTVTGHVFAACGGLGAIGVSDVAEHGAEPENPAWWSLRYVYARGSSVAES